MKREVKRSLHMREDLHMCVGVMKHKKLKLKELHTSHALEEFIINRESDALGFIYKEKKIIKSQGKKIPGRAKCAEVTAVGHRRAHLRHSPTHSVPKRSVPHPARLTGALRKKLPMQERNPLQIPHHRHLHPQQSPPPPLLARGKHKGSTSLRETLRAR
jgi:hypothetical protein